MGKFKVGDKVKVTASDDELRGDSVNIEIKNGDIRIITEVCRTAADARLDSLISGWVKLSHLEPAKFTKSDLKDGMRCTDREGDDWYVCGGSMVLLEHFDVQPISGWHENLKDKGGSDVHGDDLEVNDIMKVTDRDGTVLFEREEQKELTLQQIADKFGVDVKHIRIKE